MTDAEKKKQLKQHKALATGLFLLMAAVFIGMIFLQKYNVAGWIGYVKAFAEAAMVGALADWFAVTALFHHPLGLPIPHTNLIENSKKKIGDNLGNFVVDNFLNATTLRPYIAKLGVAKIAGEWLARDGNKKMLLTQIAILLKDIVNKLDDDKMADFLAVKGTALLEALPLQKLAGNTLSYIVEHGEHQGLVTLLAKKIKQFIRENEDLVKEKVHDESYFFVPGFIDRKLANKITGGLVKYFDEIEKDEQHRLRKELSTQLGIFAEKLLTEEQWKEKFDQFKKLVVQEDKMIGYARPAWKAMKQQVVMALDAHDGIFKQYVGTSLDEWARKLQEDVVLQQKIDGWIRHTAYRYILRNTAQVGTLISSTVGNWQGKELSEKLELEVGKDLQFIRINGTIVGGLVGLLLYAITQWLN